MLILQSVRLSADEPDFIDPDCCDCAIPSAPQSLCRILKKHDVRFPPKLMCNVEVRSGAYGVMVGGVFELLLFEALGWKGADSGVVAQ